MPVKSFTQKFFQLPRWQRITSYLTALYLLYALLLGVITPRVLQSQLPTMLSSSLGRTVSIGEININPFLLRARVSQFVIAKENSQQPFVSVDILEADVGFWRTVTTITPTLEHVFIRAPFLRVARLEEKGHTRFNFSDILDNLASSNPPATEQHQPGNAVPHVRIDHFRLTDGHLQLRDQVSGAALSYPHLTLNLVNLDTLSSITIEPGQQAADTSQNNYHIALKSEDGGELEFDGVFQLAPLEVAGQIRLREINLPPLWPLSEDMIEGHLTSGRLDFAVQYRLTESASGIHLTASKGDLTLTKLAMSDAERERLRIDEVSLSGLTLDTAESTVSAKGLDILHPVVDGVYDKASGLDLIRIFTPQTTASGSVSKDNGAPSDWQLTLGGFTLTEGDIQLNDQAVADNMYWRINPLEIETGQVSPDFSEPVDYQLSLQLAGDPDNLPDKGAGALSTNGKVNLAQQTLDGSLEFSGFKLPQLQAYVTRFANISLTEGTINSTLSYSADSNGNIVVDGQADIVSFTVLDGLHYEPLLKWQKMKLSGIRYDHAEKRLAMETIDLDQPYGKLLIDEQRRTNIGAIVKNNDKTSQSSAPTSSDQSDNGDAAPVKVNVNSITVRDGSAYFADNSLTPRFASGIEAVNGSVSDLTSQAGTAAQITLDGKIDNYAPASLQGSLNPLLDDIFLDVNFSVKGAELTSINPYAGTYMGYFIDQGQLSLDVKYKLKGNQLDGDNHVVIDQLTLGRKSDSEQALSLPLGLAIALLEDSNGVIDLGLEVSGDLDSPDFSFGSIILNALGNLIEKAVTAPFTLLADLVGSDEDELNHVDFSAGASSLDSDARERLNKLAGALRQRPGLRVSIEGTVNEVNDARQLAIDTLNQDIRKAAAVESLPGSFSPSQIPLQGPLADAVKQLFSTRMNKAAETERETVRLEMQKDGGEATSEEAVTRATHIAMYNQLRNAIKINEDHLASLAEERAKAVKVYLTSDAKIEANRLFLLNSRQHLQSETSRAVLTLKAN